MKIFRGVLSKIMLFVLIVIVFQFMGCESSCKTYSPKYKQNGAVQKNVDIERKQNIVINRDADLEGNRRLWKEKNISKYEITVSASQGGNITYPGPAVIRVQDDNEVSVSVNSYSTDKLQERYRKINTVEKIFDIIQQGYEDEAKVEVKYNKQFGYPEEVTVENLKHGIDEWIIIKISKFKIVD